MNLSEAQKGANCSPIKIRNLLFSGEARTTASSFWEMALLTQYWDREHESSPAGKGLGKNTVVVDNKAFYSWDVNYLLFGLMNRLCGNSEAEMSIIISGWSIYKPATQGDSYENPQYKKMWARQGYYYNASAPAYVDPRYTSLKIIQNEKYHTNLKATWPWPDLGR